MRVCVRAPVRCPTKPTVLFCTTVVGQHNMTPSIIVLIFLLYIYDKEAISRVLDVLSVAL